MSLEPGTQLGAYAITGRLGAGGMGEVYRATDTKLGREVAIKTLPAALASDADRLARFEREAKLLASLNHAHIASVYGLDEHDGTRYIAMELVEGESLEEKLKKGALPVEQALELGLQIAEALEAAHEKGVVHRDLKPANVMVTPDGVVKVLDFGLAKAFSGDPNEASPAHSPALSLAMTQAGLVLGTAGYMSPEQASGQATDQRADIWAFGVVLYEMQTGLPLFSGESVPHILADVLRSEPDWNRLPKNLHPRIRELLERCLEKKPRRRYAGITDARADIEAALRDPAGVAPVAAPPIPASSSRSLSARLGIGAGLVGAGMAIAAVVAWTVRPTIEDPVFSLTFLGEPPEHPLSVNGFNHDVAITDDGRIVVYRSFVEGEQTIVVRDLASSDTTPIQTGTIRNLFLSPDGNWVGYFDLDLGGFYRVPVSGGPATRIVSVRGAPRGAIWLEDDRIIFAMSEIGGGLWQVSVDGEGLEEITTPDATRGESWHEWPHALPGGEWILFTVRFEGQPPENAEIVAKNLVTGEQRRLFSGGSDARYVPTGHLVYAYGTTLRAVAFDLERLETTGIYAPVIDDLAIINGDVGVANLDFARNGTMVYASGAGEIPQRLAVRVRPDRADEPLGLEPAVFSQPVLSKDGARLALQVRSGRGTGVPRDIWIWSEDGSGGQLTFDGGDHRFPIFTPDGRDVIYSVEGKGLYRQPADGTGQPELIFETTEALRPFEMTPGGQILVDFLPRGPVSLRDIGILTPNDPSSFRSLIDGRGQKRPALSPDGNFIAYESRESRRTEIHVQTFPDIDGGHWRIPSPDGGEEPTWSADGSRIFFLTATDDRLMEVEVQTEPTVSFGDATQVLTLDPGVYEVSNNRTNSYAVFPDDGGFLFLKLQSSAESDSIKVLTNWFELLERLVPVD